MELRSEDRQAYVRLQPRRVIAPDDQQVALAVQVCADGFSGENAEVGVWAAEVRQFIAALDALERRRAGSATLRSMSPDEFTLEIAAIDRAGHIGVTGSLRKLAYAVGSSTDLAVSIAFGLDPSTLPALVDDFRRLLPSS